MEFRILNKDLIDIDILDTYESMIWTDRYSRCGDFEFYIPANRRTLDLLREDYYIWHRDSEHVMIIEDRMINTDVEEGNFITVTGRSLESILDRRIIWQQTILTGNLQNGIQKLLNENIISPTDPDRKIDNFIFEASTDPNITSLTVNAQFTGDNLYDAIVSLCETNEIGFKVILSDDNKFVFKLYAGQDRSYDQIQNPYVVFSPGFDNLLNTNYVESKKNLKTVTLVAGEGEGLERRTTTVGGGTGLDRRELFTDARDIRSETSEGDLTDAEYLAQLEERGIEKLSEHQISQVFDGQTENLIMFKYGVDYFMGDIIQLENEYGLISKSRVTELIRSHNSEGVNIYPTFTNMKTV